MAICRNETDNMGDTETTAQKLRSSFFRNAASQSELLIFVVEKGISGEPITEADLTPGRFTSESTKGRANASIVRGKLADFYQSDEGKDDCVLIELPAGASYKPVFSLNGYSHAVHLYSQGLVHRCDFSLKALTLAAEDFAVADRDSRGNSFGLVARIETRLLLFVALSLLTVARSSYLREFNRFTRYLLDQLKEKFPERDWEVHIFEGTLALFRADWNQAREFFNRAGGINPDESQRSFWYGLYLTIFNDEHMAERIVAMYLEQDPWDPLANLAAAAFHYFCGDCREATNHCLRAYRPDGEGSDTCVTLFGLIALAENEPAVALRSFVKVSQEEWLEEADLRPRVAVSRNRIPGLIILAAQRHNLLDVASRLLIDLDYSQAETKATLIPPLLPFSSALADGPPNELRPIQIAIRQVALGDLESAVDSIQCAFETEEMTALVWHLNLPIFDPLRHLEKFARLYEKVAYPTRPRRPGAQNGT